MIEKVKNEIAAGRPVLVWHAFTNAEWDVITGFDNTEKVFFGRGSYAGFDKYAKESETHSKDCLSINIPAMGAIFTGNKTGSFNSYQAELAALKEAVRHACSQSSKDQLCGNKWTFLEGIQCYTRWINDFKNPQKIRSLGDAYCYNIYRSTHRAVGDFLKEIAPKHLNIEQFLMQASEHFTEEADIFDHGELILGWTSPEGPDSCRNNEVVSLLSKARDCYIRGIEKIESAVKILE